MTNFESQAGRLLLRLYGTDEVRTFLFSDQCGVIVTDSEFDEKGEWHPGCYGLVPLFGALAALSMRII